MGSHHLHIAKVVACSLVGMRCQHHISQQGTDSEVQQFATPLPGEDGQVSTTSPSGDRQPVSAPCCLVGMETSAPHHLVGADAGKQIPCDSAPSYPVRVETSALSGWC
jgi:hypothetical protein